MRNLFFYVSLWALILSNTARAGLFDDDEAREKIAALENSSNQRLQQLEAANRKILDLVNQIDRIETTLTQVQGKLDELHYQVESGQKGQKELYIDLDNRINLLEQAKRQTQQQAENKVLQSIADHARAGKYKLALSSAQKFITSYPDSKLLGAAYYWVGLSQAGLKSWALAEATLEKMIYTYPEEEYVPDALLALASVQASQRKQAASERTLQRLIEHYKNSPAAIQAKKALKVS